MWRGGRGRRFDRAWRRRYGGGRLGLGWTERVFVGRRRGGRGAGGARRGGTFGGSITGKRKSEVRRQRRNEVRQGGTADRSKRGFSTTQADAFTRSECEGKASICSGRNDSWLLELKRAKEGLIVVVVTGLGFI